MGYFIPVRYGLGVWPDGRVVGAPPSPSASSGKCPNIRKCALFPKWTCLKIPEMLVFQEQKPRRVLHSIGELFRKLTSTKSIHVYDNLKKSLFPNNMIFLKDFADPGENIPKIKMVRMVHMNIFYRMDFKNYDPRGRCSSKTYF